MIVAPPLVTDRLLGRLAGLTGDAEAAARYFEGALEFCRGAGYRPELAGSRHDYARFLLDRTLRGTNKAIAHHLSISLNTVAVHVARILAS